MKGTTANIFKGLFIVLGVLGLAFVIVAIVISSLTGEFQVTNGGTKFEADADNIVNVELGQAYYFNCAVSGNAGFEIRVLPSADCQNFNFAVNDRSQPFAKSVDNYLQQNNYAKGFQIDKSDAGFALILPSALTMHSILSEVFKSFGSVEMSEQMAIGSQFSIVVIPKNGAGAVTIQLNCGGEK